MNKLWILSLAAVLSVGVATGCKKKKANQQEATLIATDNAIAESAFNDLSGMADESAEGEENFKSYKSTCATTLSYDTIAGKPTVNIDFGPVNCTCADGRLRRGKVFITFNGPYYETGSSVVTTTEDYFVDDYEIIGTRTATYNGDRKYTIVVSGKILKPNNAGTIYWDCTKTRTQTAGYTTPFNWLDNVYSIDGSANGITATGVPFSIDITDPLMVQLGCRWIKSGKLLITRPSKDNVTIDYGSGDCDNKATMTIGKKSQEITLKGW